MKISPRARRVANENGISPESLRIEGTGFGGGICEKDILDYLAKTPASAIIRATSLAKNVANVEGLELSSIVGTGVNGKIMRKDVDAITTAAAAAVSMTREVNANIADAADHMEFFDGKEILQEIPYKGIRKIIGERMAESKFTAPHLYFTQKVNLEKLLELRKQVNEIQEQKVSVTDFIAKATILTLQKYPDMNSSLEGDKIIQYKSVNVGIAVAAPSGLIVPVLKNAQNMNIVKVAETSSALFEKARIGKLSTDEYKGGTFTISNLGMFGIENFTAIINPPEVGILAISSTKDEPFVVTKADGTKEITIKPMMNIQLSVDHRVVDGLLAAQFVTEVKRLLENPLTLLI